MRGVTVLIAHRGLSAHAPENTFAAFRAAARAGFTWIETDLDLTSCGTPVLMHDDTLDRTTDGQGRVSEVTYEQLRQYDAGAWFSEDFSGERVPPLSGPEGLVAWLREEGISANLELKLTDPTPERRARLCEVVAEAAEQLREVTVILSSFDHDLLAEVTAALGTGEAEGGLSLAPLFEPGEFEDQWEPAARRLGASHVHPHFEDLSAEVLRRVRGTRVGGAGLEVNTYTVNATAPAEDLRAWGVAGICTDLPPEELLPES